MSEYDFSKIVHDVGVNENIVDCKLEHKYLTSKGDGYLGTVQAVQLVGRNKKLDLIFKFSHRNPKSHESLPLRDIYLNEIIFYKNITPAFVKFQEEYQIKKPFNNTAKFYGAITEPLNELLVLENLKTSNYDLWDRKKLMNKEHLELAMQTFAKFHGTSFAMEKIKPTLFKSLTQSMRDDDALIKLIIKMGLIEEFKTEIKELARVFDSQKEKKYAGKLLMFAENLEKEFKEVLMFHEKDVVTQGDCWCNNAMYSYDDYKHTQPKDMKMLDFQCARLASPVMDLSYFFYTITAKENYDNWKHFMKVYHDTLRSHLEKFHLNVDQIYPYAEFEKHWSKLSKFGFILCFLIRRAMLMESADAPDITEGNFLGNMNVQPESEKLYYQQMKDVAIHFIDNQFI